MIFSWTSPNENTFKLNFAGKDGNKPTSGSAAILRDWNRDISMIVMRQYLYIISSFEAEQTSLLYGLFECSALKEMKRIVVEGDSQQIIDVLNKVECPPKIYSEIFEYVLLLTYKFFLFFFS